jgi:hypothetical protein
MSVAAAAATATAAGGTAITGTKSVPVFAAKFANTGADPYAAAPTGTMTEFYEENSYGVFTVSWHRLRLGGGDPERHLL